MYIIEWRVIGGLWLEWSRFKTEDSRDFWLKKLQGYQSTLFEFRAEVKDERV